MYFKFLLAISLIFSFILASSNIQAVLINEVMYNPPAEIGGTSNEWIELYNPSNETINLTGWSISDPSEHAIADSLIQPLSFIILAKNLTAFHKYYNFSCNATKVAFSLSNDGEDILLKNYAKEVEDALNYSDDVGGDGDGKSIQMIDGVQTAMVPTPCEINTLNNETENETNVTTICDIMLWVEAGDIFIGSKENNYRLMVEDLRGSDAKPEVEYWIENMFGGIARSKERTNKTNTERTWTPQEISGTEAYVIRALITNTTCNDTDTSNNYAEKVIIVIGHAPVLNSSISIINVNLGSGDKAKFGERIEIKMNAYKGETSKNSVEIWAENAQGIKIGKTDLNLYSKFSNFTLSIPLQLSPNCDTNLPNGPYFVRAEGLDSFDEKEIWIEGISDSLCETKTMEVAKTCPPSSCPSCNMQEKNEPQHKSFEILSCPEEIARNMEVLIELFINTTESGNYTLYSYVYDGKKPLSLGFDGKKWLNTWSANKQEIFVTAPTVIILKNMIANDTEPGTYKLRVKIAHEGKEEEITRSVIIKEAAMLISQKPETEAASENNETSDDGQKRENISKKEIKTPTGGIISKAEDNWFSAAINSLINFFKNLFKL